MVYMMDFNSGEIFGYWPGNFQMLIKSDDDLYTAFSSIEGYNKKKYQIFNYMNEFNERNPIYFPTKTNDIFNLEGASEIFIEKQE